jgi:YVTN family beta-propeller protein
LGDAARVKSVQKKFINRLAIVLLTTLPIAAATEIVPAGASAISANFRVANVHALVSPNIPNSNVVGKGPTATFSPNHLKYTDQSTSDCEAPVSFTITNTGTTRWAFLYRKGSLLAEIPAGDVVGVCAEAPAGKTGTFTLGNSAGTKEYAATLKVTSLAAAADAYVANSGDNTVSVIDTSTNTVVKTVGVGSVPTGVAITPNGSYA